MRYRLLALASLVALSLVAQPPAGAQEMSGLLAVAAKHRREGNLRLAIELLEKACPATQAQCAPAVAGELGVAYYQARRLQLAQTRLTQAYTAATPDSAQRALYANDLGNLSASLHRREDAIRYYEEARAAAGPGSAIGVSAGLNLARLAPADQRLSRLRSLWSQIGEIGDGRERARYLVNLGSQARELGKPARRLSYESLDRARTLAREAKDHWLLAEALDNLAQLYEDNGRFADALELCDDGLAQLQQEQVQDLAIRLQWRRGRLLRQQGRDELAVRAYQSAVEQIEAIRQDIPIEYADGRSSFRETLEPIYLGLAELLLKQGEQANGAGRGELLRRARDTVELIKQTELQDYLGERCAVESAQSLRDTALPARTAVLYPVILERGLALLLETAEGIEVRQVPASARSLQQQALALASSLREEKSDFLAPARSLYDAILRPVDDVLRQQNVDTLIVVPDSVLRLVPLAALHDGEQFAIAKYAIAVAPGLTMTSPSGARGEMGKVLLAGLSEPGPVVDKLREQALRNVAPAEPSAPGRRSADPNAGLALPGVVAELEALQHSMRSDRLLNQEFTVERFRQQVTSGDYRIVHVASHAVFSPRAEDSFIMAYDDVITIDALQTYLRAESLQKNPIELLSLSACQTAEGDDRAPLGIAGAALRARAAAALGSLWPVEDEATKTLMVRFYQGLSAEGLGKAKALQKAQLELLHNKATAHPFYWAPFVLVGSWQ